MGNEHIQMQQKKISNFHKFNKFKSSKTQLFSKKNFKLFLSRKYLKNKNYSFPLNLQKNLLSNKKRVYRINILFKSNNFFCTLTNFVNKEVLYCVSSGNYNVNTSKKLLKHTFKLVLERFLRVIKRKVKNNNLIIKITSPTHLRKKVLDLILLNKIKSNVIFQIQRSKCYNGCRPPKRQRKKRKGLKLLK